MNLCKSNIVHNFVGRKMIKWWLFASAVVAFIAVCLFKRERLPSKLLRISVWQNPVQTVVETPQILWWYQDLFPYTESPVTRPCRRGSCMITNSKSVVNDEQTRGLIFYGTDFRCESAPLPRKPHHMWALLHEESPKNNYMFTNENALELFNLTSTCSRYSDYPLSLQYIPSLDYLTKRPPVALAEKNKARKNDGLAVAAYVQTICDNPSDRDRYIKELMKYISVDAMGACLHNRNLPIDFSEPKAMFEAGFYEILSRYKFILAFENGICNDYMTEKLWRPHHLGVVPVYRGSPSVRDWLPNNKSAILVDEFESPAKLAKYLQYLDSNDSAYEEHLLFKQPGGVTNHQLVKRLEERLYSTNVETFDLVEEGKPSFMEGFSCFVCDKIHERIALEEKHRKNGLPPPAPWTADKKHFDCPRPHPPLGDLEKVVSEEPESIIATWDSAYKTSQHDAQALKNMILAGETDSGKFFDYVHEVHQSEEPSLFEHQQ